MKFLVFADLQAADGHERCFHDPLVPLQRWRVSKTLELIQKLYSEHRCSGIIDLGDTTDDRQAIPIPTIQALLTPLHSFTGGLNIKLVGNHEQWLRSTVVHPGAMYSTIYRVVENAEVINFRHCPVVFACVSFIDDPDKFSEAIISTVKEAQATKKKVVLLGHGPITGAVASGQRLNDGVACDSIPQIDMGLFGHIHKHQKLKGNIFYVGSPFEQDFGEMGDKKYVAILDTEDLTLKWIDTEMPRYRRVTFGQFKQVVQEGSEDRYEVRVNSHEESLAFFAHPLATRAIVAYDYDQDSGTSSDASVKEESDFSIPALLRAYVASHPPSSAGLSIPDEELVEYGSDLVKS